MIDTVSFFALSDFDSRHVGAWLTTAQRTARGRLVLANQSRVRHGLSEAIGRPSGQFTATGWATLADGQRVGTGWRSDTSPRPRCDVGQRGALGASTTRAAVGWPRLDAAGATPW